MAYSQFATNRPVLARVGSLVAASTLVLTLAFFGLIAFATDNTAGVSGRVPYYVLGAAVTFAATLVGLDRRNRDGRNLLVVSLATAIGAFVLVTFGLEGVAYALRQPADALAFRRILYLVSAALFATGLGYWAVNHWRELTRDVRRRKIR